jgi:glycosyltransferase involved in cell wall biosynthesis
VLVAAALHRAQLALLLRHCDRIWVTTETRRASIRGLARAVRGDDDVGLLRIGPNALPLPAATERHGHRKRIAVFSTLAAGKRFDVVLDAFDALVRQVPDAELLLIGDLGSPDDAAYRRLDARIAASPAASRIARTGKVSLAALSEALASLDLYMFPMDTGANTRSGTLPAALGSGLPVIAIRGKETDAIFRHGENVWFARALDAPAFAEAAVRVLDDEALRATLRAGAIALYEKHLSWAATADAILGA